MSTVTVSSALVGWLLAYVPSLVKNARAIKVAGSRYNQEPRATLERVIAESSEEDASYLRRALAAHNNQMECLPWFFASLLFAWLTQVPMKTIDAVALTYVVARLAFIYFYLATPSALTSTLRSLSWLVCVVACGYLFVTAAAYAPKPNY
jgi:uncharacterized MAPEG superfamily protein